MIAFTTLASWAEISSYVYSSGPLPRRVRKADPEKKAARKRQRLARRKKR